MRIKLIRLFVLSLMFVVTNCETSFTSNTRLLVEGTIKDSEGLPIENAEISTYTHRTTGLLFFPAPTGSDEYLLGRNYSDSNGKFSVVSLYDRNYDFSIEIKANENYSEYIYRTNTNDYTPDDLKFNLQNVTLNTLVDLNFAISRTSGEGNSITYTFNYSYPTCIEIYEAGVLDPNQSYCNYPSSLGQTLNDDNPNHDSSFSVALGSTVEFVYSINNDPEITETFIIDQPTYEFSFNY